MRLVRVLLLTTGGLREKYLLVKDNNLLGNKYNDLSLLKYNSSLEQHGICVLSKLDGKENSKVCILRHDGDVIGYLNEKVLFYRIQDNNILSLSNSDILLLKTLLHKEEKEDRLTGRELYSIELL